jgi:hypothetical protein
MRLSAFSRGSTQGPWPRLPRAPGWRTDHCLNFKLARYAASASCIDELDIFALSDSREAAANICFIYRIVSSTADLRRQGPAGRGFEPLSNNYGVLPARYIKRSADMH